MLLNRVTKNSLRVIRRSPVGPDELIVKQILTDLDLHQGFRSVILRYFNAADVDGRKIAAALVADNASGVFAIGRSPRHDLRSIIDTAWNRGANPQPRQNEVPQSHSAAQPTP
jgi:hypothetical protein